MTEIATVDLPSWAIPLFANGDNSHLTDDDERTALEWYDDLVEEHGPITLDYSGDRDEFTPYPAFGLACDTERVTIYADGKVAS